MRGGISSNGGGAASRVRKAGAGAGASGGGESVISAGSGEGEGEPTFRLLCVGECRLERRFDRPVGEERPGVGLARRLPRFSGVSSSSEIASPRFLGGLGLTFIGRSGPCCSKSARSDRSLDAGRAAAFGHAALRRGRAAIAAVLGRAASRRLVPGGSGGAAAASAAVRAPHCGARCTASMPGLSTSPRLLPSRQPRPIGARHHGGGLP